MLFYELPDFGIRLSRQTLNRSSRALRKALPLFRTPKCALPLPPPPALKPKIAWEYAFWNFQAPKTLKCALPLPPPPPLKAQDCLGMRILELSSAQNTKMCTSACPPPLRAPVVWRHAFYDFRAPKTLKYVLPPAPPCLRAQDCVTTHFGTFKRPKH